MTPAYGMKRWWRARRLEGESLKAFARRWTAPGKTAWKWLGRKRSGRSSGSSTEGKGT